MQHGATAFRKSLAHTLATLALAAAAAAAGCAADPPGAGGSGGSGPSGGGGEGGSNGGMGFGGPTQTGSGRSMAQYQNAMVTRNGVNYLFMTNGWGPGFESQTSSWQGTSFVVESMQGTQGPNYEPASYPTVFCGVYSATSGACGLPKPIADITSLRTGWIWHANGNTGQYNAAYDIWLADSPTSGRQLTAYLMVWLRDPPGQQPAGSIRAGAVTVANVPGTWDVWQGMVNSRPYIAYARSERQDSSELEFDVMDFVRDIPGRGLTLPGSHILSVAVGFEIWNGPVTNLATEDFYVDVR